MGRKAKANIKRKVGPKNSKKKMGAKEIVGKTVLVEEEPVEMDLEFDGDSEEKKEMATIKRGEGKWGGVENDATSEEKEEKGGNISEGGSIDEAEIEIDESILT